MSELNSPAFLFDDMRIWLGTFKAFKAGNEIQLERKALRLLLLLVENRGRLIEKEEIPIADDWIGSAFPHTLTPIPSHRRLTIAT